jgi:hypothetical protein
MLDIDVEREIFNMLNAEIRAEIDNDVIDEFLGSISSAADKGVIENNDYTVKDLVKFIGEKIFSINFKKMVYKHQNKLTEVYTIEIYGTGRLIRITHDTIKYLSSNRDFVAGSEEYQEKLTIGKSEPEFKSLFNHILSRIEDILEESVERIFDGKVSYLI